MAFYRTIGTLVSITNQMPIYSISSNRKVALCFLAMIRTYIVKHTPCPGPRQDSGKNETLTSCRACPGGDKPHNPRRSFIL